MTTNAYVGLGFETRRRTATRAGASDQKGAATHQCARRGHSKVAIGLGQANHQSVAVRKVRECGGIDASPIYCKERGGGEPDIADPAAAPARFSCALPGPAPEGSIVGQSQRTDLHRHIKGYNISGMTNFGIGASSVVELKITINSALRTSECWL